MEDIDTYVKKCMCIVGTPAFSTFIKVGQGTYFISIVRIAMGHQIDQDIESILGIRNMVLTDEILRSIPNE